jgi:hypothetical protein
VLAALHADGGPIATALAASQEIEQAAQAVAEAEHELDLFIGNPKLYTLLGEQKFLEAVEVRQRQLDKTRQRLSELRSQSAVASELAGGDLLAAWPSLSVQEKRRLLQGLLDEVIPRRARVRGRKAPPIGERTQIVLRGNVLLDGQCAQRPTLSLP